jgi:hypothetical protein
MIWSVSHVSLKRLKAMHLWAQTQQWQGVVPLLQNFTNEALAETLKWMKAIANLKMVMEDTEVLKFPKLTELSKCTRWWELLTTYLGWIQGTAMVPLIYPVQEQVKMTPEIRDAEYTSAEDEWIAISMAHSGAHYELDNQYLYDKLKPIMVDGPGWSLVKKFDKKKAA